MSLENIGIGGVLSFNGAEAISGMAAVTLAANNLNKSQTQLTSSSSGLGTAFGMLGGQIQGIGMSLMPFTNAVEASIASAAKFQDTIQALKVTTGAGAEAVGAFAMEAKQFAADGEMGASDIALGMAALSRAGATNNEVLANTKPLMDAAVASQQEMGKTTEEVANVLRSFNLQFSDTGRVADVLTFVGARTTGGMAALADSMRAAGTTSNMLGINLSTTAALLSEMTNAGLKGASAGQAFTTMMDKLITPSKKGASWLKANNIELKHFADGSIDVVDALTKVTNYMDGYADVAKRATATHDLFGIRGAKAFNSIREAIVSGRLPELMGQIQSSAEGAANRMAQIRMDSFTQQMKVAGNVLETFGIEVGGHLLGPITDTLKMFTHVVSGITHVLLALENPTADLTKLQEEYGQTIVSVAQGINDGIHGVMDAWAEIKPAILSTIQAITGSASPDMIRTLARWATEIFAVAAAVAPVLIAFGAVAAFIATVLAPAIEGLGPIVAVVGGGVAALGIVFGIVFAGMSSDTESTGSVINRVFNVAKDNAGIFVDEGVMPIVGAIVGPLTASMEGLKAQTSIVTTSMKKDFQEVFGYIVRQSPIMHDAWTIAVSLMTSAITAFANMAILDFKTILAAISPVTTAVKELALWILENLTHAMRTVAKAAIGIADALGLSKGSAGWAAVAGIASQTDDDLDAGTQSGHVRARVGSVVAAQALGKRDADDGQPQVYAGPGGGTVDSLNGNDAAQKTDDQIIRGAGHAVRQAQVHVGVAIDDKRKIDISNCMTVDGRSMAVATGKYHQEINERTGFKATPWQRRQVAETGSTPVNQ